MQTIKIDFLIPQSWQELNDIQLRYVYQLLSAEYSAGEIKTFCLLRWSNTKVVGHQDDGSYLLRKEKTLFSATPIAIAEILPHLDWLDSIPTYPVRITKIRGHKALPADFSEVPFETFIICDNLYQGYLQTQNEDLLSQLGSTLYCKNIGFKPYERISIFYWFASLKEYLSNRFPDFFQPVEAATGGNLLGASPRSVEASMNAQIRALTKGDITKESQVLSLDTHRALTELDAQAREYKELNSKLQSK